MVRWLRWHCPPDTGFEFEPWRSEAEHATSRSRRLSTILTFTRGWGRNNFVSFKPPRPGTEPRTLAWKAAVLTTTLGPPPFRLKEILLRMVRWIRWTQIQYKQDLKFQPTQQTQNICIAFVQRLPCCYNIVQTLYKWFVCVGRRSEAEYVRTMLG